MALPRADGRPEDDARAGPDIHALLTASTVPALLTDPAASDDPIVFANPAFLALTGYDGDEVIGRNLRMLQGPGSDRSAWIALREGLSADLPITAELLAARKDGGSFWAELSVVPVRAPDGRLAWRLCQICDVTRRRDAEGALALSRQREALGLLTNSVAHEFNNYLQILIGYIDGLKRRLGDRPEPFIQRALSRSTDAVERATILTRQLLTHSRRIAPEVRPVDLDATVAEIAERLRPTLPAKIGLTVTRTPGLPRALSNPTQIEFALSHVIANACEAMPMGGEIGIATFALSPSDRAMQRPSEGAVGIAVSDAGQGMTPEIQARALAPFATTREAGRGAGLAIVHGLMKRQNGTISLDSRPGEGTVVRLVFPAAV